MSQQESILTTFAEVTQSDPLLIGKAMLRELWAKMEQTKDSGVFEVFPMNDPASPNFCRGWTGVEYGEIWIYHKFGYYKIDDKAKAKCNVPDDLLFKNNKALFEKTRLELYDFGNSNLDPSAGRCSYTHDGFSRGSLLLALGTDNRIYVNYSNHDTNHICPETKSELINPRLGQDQKSVACDGKQTIVKYDSQNQKIISTYTENQELDSFYRECITSFINHCMKDNPVFKKIKDEIIRQTQERHSLLKPSTP
jgi:hypothetical protein